MTSTAKTERTVRMGYDEKNDHGEGRVPCELFIYLMFFVAANGADWITALSDDRNPDMDILFLCLSCAVVIILTSVILYKKKIALWRMTGRADCVPLAFLLFLALIRIALPDVSYDTLNYHLFWQDSFGQDIVRYHFFPTRVINSLFFCLGDRTYHIFRVLLGYRGGAILGTLALMVIYLQGKVFLQKVYVVITGQEPERIYKVLISSMSLLCILSEQILAYVDTYYVDWLALPFLIEVLARIFFAGRQGDADICILGVMAGVCVCIKPSNFVFVFFLCVLYVIKFCRKIRWQAWGCGVICSFLVCVPYMHVGYGMTDNPVFPYLNSIFKSGWFFFMGVDEYSGIKDLFGPDSFREYILWPWYMLFRSDKIYFSDYRVYCGRLPAALVMASVSIVWRIRGEKAFLLRRINGIFVGLYILYLTCLNGHLRYALFLEWYAGIALAVTVMVLWRENNLKIYKMTGIGICVLPMIFSMRWTADYLFDSGECVQRQSLFEDPENWIRNARYLFRDHKKTDLPVNDVGGFIVFDTNGSMMSRTVPDVPIVNIRSGALTETGKKQCDAILSDIEAHGRIYSISKPNALVHLIDAVEEQKYSVESVYTISLPDMVNTGQFCYLVSVRKGEKKIQVYEGVALEEIWLDPSLAGKKLNVWIGRKWRDMSDEDVVLEICVDSDEEVIETSLDIDGKFYQCDVQLPDVLDKEVRIRMDAGNLMNKWIVVQY